MASLSWQGDTDNVVLTKSDETTLVLSVGDCISSPQFSETTPNNAYIGKITAFRFSSSGSIRNQPTGIFWNPWRGNRWGTSEGESNEGNCNYNNIFKVICPMDCSPVAEGGRRKKSRKNRHSNSKNRRRSHSNSKKRQF